MKIDLGNLHHAYLLVGSSEEAYNLLSTSFSQAGLDLVGHPDFFNISFDTFGIDDARELTSRSVRKALSGRKVFLISIKKITAEAQNALLKTFEDPVPDTHFFLSVREEAQVIPTLLSRMQVVHVSDTPSITSDAKKFISSSLKDRLSYANKFSLNEGNLAEFLDSILLIGKEQELPIDIMKSIYKLRAFANDRAPNKRLVMEHLALVL